MAEALRVYWWRERNFGDLLTVALLRRFGLSVEFGQPWEADLVGAGSVLEHLSTSYRGLILGAGFMWAHSAMRFPRSGILAVRGELTRRIVGAPQPTPLGDLGLLAPHLLSGRPEMGRQIGLVPHYVDMDNPKTLSLSRSLGEDLKIIDPRNEPEDVALAIGSCRAILSSSLHGLVFADALGVPNAWVELSDKVLGRGFKFRDYYSAFGEERAPMALSGMETVDRLWAMAKKPPDKVAEVAAKLEGLCRGLEGELASYRERTRLWRRTRAIRGLVARGVSLLPARFRS